MKVKFLFYFIFSLFWVRLAFAQTPPTLSNPSNNAIVSTPALNWDTPSYQLYSSNPYRVQVDDNPSFSPSNSIYRDTYKTSTTYTPVLTDGVWYWRIKARDTTGTWSEWSNTWSFTLTTTSPTSTPTSTPSTIPTSTPASAPSSSSSQNSFTISNIPTHINSDQSFKILVQLSLSDSPNSSFFLKGAFKKTDSSNYFGKTLVSGSWIKNGSSYSSQYKITTDGSGNWSGNLEIRADSDDSGFSGTGDYIFKVGRYNSSGSGPIWSNEQSIKINEVNASSQTAVESQNTASSSQPESGSTTSPNKTTLAKNTPSAIKYKIASIAGISKSASNSPTPSTKVEVKDQKQFNLFLVAGFLLIFAGISSLGYIYFKRK